MSEDHSKSLGFAVKHVRIKLFIEGIKLPVQTAVILRLNLLENDIRCILYSMNLKQCQERK